MISLEIILEHEKTFKEESTLENIGNIDARDDCETTSNLRQVCRKGFEWSATIASSDFIE